MDTSSQKGSHLFGWKTVQCVCFEKLLGLVHLNGIKRLVRNDAIICIMGGS